MANNEYKGRIMSKLLQEVNDECEELRIIMERVELFLDKVPTLLEDAEKLLGQVSAALKSGKSLANNPTIGKILAGLTVLKDPDNRNAIAPEVKGMDNKFTINDVMATAGENKAANQVLTRIATMYAKKEIANFENRLKLSAEDPQKNKELIQIVDKLRLDYVQIMNLIKNKG